MRRLWRSVHRTDSASAQPTSCQGSVAGVASGTHGAASAGRPGVIRAVGPKSNRYETGRFRVQNR